jgi:2-haloalkanoic acid dehalogenase type II
MHTAKRKYDAVLFDLLTALLDSWTLWNEVAGSAEAGRRWRAAYLDLTYGCGAYRPYEDLVAQAARACGLPDDCPKALTERWLELRLWPGVDQALARLSGTLALGVVTNCSERLGRAAAGLAGVRFDVVITAEAAGCYKPDPRAYRMALSQLGLPPERVLFVAGSGFDLFGTQRCGLDTYWHNRVGLAAPPGAPAPLLESRTLDDLPALALSL